ncbi:MAG: acyltransferase, ws/dgat/mgat subfamily protein [Pseudonocardiales bacterium]|nr:acyltransferase, ws/dgat/mgat subfamily protein [Pseudonocardiales bacterium]
MAGLERLSDRELGGMEALFVKGDAEVGSRSTVIALFSLDGEPSFTDVLAIHDRASRVVVRLRQRVVAPVIPISRPYWVVDPDFDLSYHVRTVRLTSGGTARDLLDFAERTGQVPLDPARPLWEAHFITGIDGGQSAVLYKFHHAITDGSGGPDLLAEIYSSNPALSDLPLPPAPAVEDVTAVELTRQRLGQLPLQLAGSAVGAISSAASAGRKAVLSPRSSVTGAVDYVSSIRRTMGETVAEPSPLLSRRGQRRYYATVSGATDDLRAAAKRLGCSVNDAYLSALSGGLGRYHDELGLPTETIPIALPVSIRRPEDPLDSNRFVGARVAAPIGEPDPAERARLIGEQVRQVRAEPALGFLSVFAPAASLLPLWMLAAVAGPQKVDVQASNIPSWPERRYLAGAQLTATWSFGPLATAAIMSVMATYGGEFEVALNMDLDAVAEPATLARLIQESFAEIIGTGKVEATL